MDRETLNAWAESPFGRVLKNAALADADRRAAPDAGWWRDESKWAGGGDVNDPTASEAIGNVRAACHISPSTMRQEAVEQQQTYWRGVDWAHLEAKAKQTREEAELLDRQAQGEPIELAYAKMLRAAKVAARWTSRRSAVQMRLPSL